MVKVLVVGCGLTATSLLHYCRNISPALFELDVFDMADHSAGRMMTHAHSVSQFTLTTDLGAQYLTKYKPESNDIFEYLENQGLIQRFDASSGIISGVREKYAKLPHFTIPRGSSSLVTGLLGDQKVHRNVKVVSIDIEENGVKVRHQSHNLQSIETNPEVKEDIYDCVVSTIPAPFLRQIEGNFLSRRIRSSSPSSQTVTEALEQVQYSTRFALSLYCMLPKATFEEEIGRLPYKARYIYDTPIIRYLSFEYWKEIAAELSSATTQPLLRLPKTISKDDMVYFSILLHTTVPFAQQVTSEIIETEDVKERIRNELKELYPNIPWGSTIISDYLHYWKFSQISSTFTTSSDTDAKPGKYRFWTFHHDKHRENDGISRRLPLLMVSGEMFTESNFEGCVESAKAAANYLIQAIDSERGEGK